MGCAVLVCEHERVDDVGLGCLGRAALDHHDGVLGGGDDHVDVGLRLLLERREGDELAVDARDADRRERTAPRDVGDVQRALRRPVIARTSVGFSLSLERTVAMICVSFL